MRIQEVKISGFRSIPFCAQADFDADPATITWDDGAFTVTFPTGFGAVDRDEINWEDDQIQASALDEDETPKLLSTLIGANSSGKSSVLLALELLLSGSTKVDEKVINNWEDEDSQGRQVIIEVSAVGIIDDPDNWCQENCDCILIDRGGGSGSEYLCRLTVARHWTTSSNTYNRYIRRSDGFYHKAGRDDRGKYESLLPRYYLIAADTDLQEEITPGKSRSLMRDLFNQAFERFKKGQPNSLVNQMQNHLDTLAKILDREKSTQVDWGEIEVLEELLAEGLSSVNPSARVGFSFLDCLPSVKDLFTSGEPWIHDGVTLAPDDHGLGMQRSFVVSTLRAWCEYVGHSQSEDDQDYFFAIEEPEIYLHPHAIRVMINTLEEIAEQDQVVFTTHSDEFANRVPLENIRVLRRDGTKSHVTKPDLSGVDARQLVKIRRYLVEDRSDMLFARSVILVEGQAELFALPAFARKLGYDIDRAGVSVVCANGWTVFQHYHRILKAFHIPHIIFGDGDGDVDDRKDKYKGHMSDLDLDLVYILPEDFEYLIVETVADDNRLLKIINACRRRKGKQRTSLGGLNWQSGSNEEKARKLQSYGKPLLGRVLGDELTAAEVEQMDILKEVLEKAKELAETN
jgi:predicted ATP-dependent endonuclease of OLD family